MTIAVTASDVLNIQTVFSILENMDERLDELAENNYYNECRNVSDEAKTELLTLLKAWAIEHVNFSQFLKESV